MSTLGIVLVVLIVVALIVLAGSVRIVRQSTALVIERLGKYNRTLDTGVHLLV